MGSRMKEEERIERAIRGLLKCPENRGCINCNSLGPQYVCTTFWTFICTNCSGIHREFTHRVKSVSMAKFSAEEVSALQAGGNERARQIYFKDWDPRRNSYPDSSNLYKLRDFIKSVYVDRKYSSEGSDNISRLRLADTDSSRKCKNIGTLSIGSRSPNDGSKSERLSYGRNGDGYFKSYFEEKSPQHVRHSPRYGGLQRSPVRFEIVDDRFRDDRGVKRYDGRSFKESRGSPKSFDLSNNRHSLSSPVVHPMRELLGDDAPRLRVGNLVKAEERKDEDDNSTKNQTAASSNKKTVQQKRENQESLIDFMAASEPAGPKLAPEKKQMPQSNDSSSQSSSELPASDKATENPDPNSLEALLFGLSSNSFEECSKSDISSTASVHENPAVGLENQISISPNSFDASPTNIPAQSSTAGPLGSVSTEPTADSFNTEDTDAQTTTPNNQLSVVSSSPDLEGPSSEESTLNISKPSHGTFPADELGNHQEETKSSGREELPEDLFSGCFSFTSPQVHGWQSGLHHGMGFSMPYYHNPLTMGALQYTAKPKNPFDIGSETDPPQASQFPSMAAIQEAPPHVLAPRGFSESATSAVHSPGFMASQVPFYTTPMVPRPPFISNLSPGAYMAQQTHMNTLLSPRTQEEDGVGTEGNSLNPTNVLHQGSNGYPSLANPYSYHSRGNPFE